MGWWFSRLTHVRVFRFVFVELMFDQHQFFWKKAKNMENDCMEEPWEKTVWYDSYGQLFFSSVIKHSIIQLPQEKIMILEGLIFLSLLNSGEKGPFPSTIVVYNYWRTGFLILVSINLLHYLHLLQEWVVLAKCSV